MFGGLVAVGDGVISREPAEHGRWREGPGYELFAALKKKLGSPRIIAEDLGFLTEDVNALLKECGYPGMKVLEFAFDRSMLPFLQLVPCSGCAVIWQA